MARTRKMTKKKKYDWFESKVNLEWTTADMTNSAAQYADSLYIDVGESLSILNRKLVRQGQLFRISNMRIFTDEKDSDTNDDYRVKIGVIPTNWVTRNAWVKAKALFDEMNEMASENIGGKSTFPKWHDFKVYMNKAHKAQAIGNTETLDRAVDLDGVSYPNGEWTYSQFSDSGASPDEFTCHMMGLHTSTGTLSDTSSNTNYDSVGLILAYAQSRIKPHAPSPVEFADTEDSPWARLFGDDQQTKDVMEHLQDDNDFPPYDVNNYIGATSANAGNCIYTGRLQEGNIPLVSTKVPTFVAPLGLIRIEIDANLLHQSSGTPIDKVHISFDATPIGPMDM